MAALDLSSNPMVAAKKLVSSAYNYNKKSRRDYLRVLQQVLKLAE